ncbi:MAG: acyl-CoA dehydrogenase [Acidobacteriota bacterium]
MNPPSPWQRLCPFPLRDAPPLAAIEACLDEPSSAEALEECERSESYPATVIDRLRDRGLADLFAEDGGAGSCVTAYHLAALNALAARRSGSLAITLGVNALALLPVLIGGTSEQIAAIAAKVRGGSFLSLALTEIAHGSDLLAGEVKAERTAAGYAVWGDKDLVNGGSRHGVILTLARTRGRDGDRAAPLAGRRDFSILAVDRDDSVSVVRRWRTLPAAAADIASVRFSGTRVAETARIGAEGDGLALIQKTLAVSRGGIGALASGAATRARELALAYARYRVLYGRPIAALPPITEHLVRLHALDLACAAMSVKAMAACNGSGIGAAPITAIAKLACVDLAEEAVSEGRQVLSAQALLRGSPYERLVRDALLYGVFDGTRHLMVDQAQWRLAQAASQDPVEPAVVLARASETYATPPRKLVEACRLPAAAILPEPEAHARALAALPSAIDLAPLSGVVDALLGIVREARHRGRWDASEALRTRAAETHALCETLMALGELADPERRRALGMTAHDDGDPVARYALGWLGARAAGRVRELWLLSGFAMPPRDLEVHEARLVAMAEDAIAAVRGWIASVDCPAWTPWTPPSSA